MKVFNVPVCYQMYGFVPIDAEDWDDAIEKAQTDEVELPKDAEYVQASWEVDVDAIDFYKEVEN